MSTSEERSGHDAVELTADMCTDEGDGESGGASDDTSSARNGSAGVRPALGHIINTYAASAGLLVAVALGALAGANALSPRIGFGLRLRLSRPIQAGALPMAA